LTSLGFQLLEANGFILNSPGKKPPDPHTFDFTPPTKPNVIIWDNGAIVNKLAIELVETNIIITGWLYTSPDWRVWNIIASYKRAEKMLVFIEGPHIGGHWGHEASQLDWGASRAVADWFPDEAHIPLESQQTIIRFLKTQDLN